MTALLVLAVTGLVFLTAVVGAVAIGAVVVAVETLIMRRAQLRRDRADVARLGVNLRIVGRY